MPEPATDQLPSEAPLIGAPDPNLLVLIDAMAADPLSEADGYPLRIAPVETPNWRAMFQAEPSVGDQITVSGWILGWAAELLPS